MSVLVLGIGNLLASDDGIGVRVVRQISERYALPAQVKVVDGGTLGIHLLPQVQSVRRLVVVDAVDMGAPPGTVARYRGEELPPPARKLSPHQMGLNDLLHLASILQPPPEEVVLWGVQPASVGLSTELSAAVRDRVDPLVRKVLEELARWGIVAVAKGATPLAGGAP